MPRVVLRLSREESQRVAEYGGAQLSGEYNAQSFADWEYAYGSRAEAERARRGGSATPSFPRLVSLSISLYECP